MNNKKGQASMEMLMTVAGFLAFLVPIVLLSYSVINLNKEDISKYAAESMVNQIASEVDTIYAQGYDHTGNIGASSIIYINIPGNVDSINFANNTITAHLKIGGAPYDAVAYVNAPIDTTTMDIKDKHGILPIRIFANLGGDNGRKTVVTIVDTTKGGQ